MWENIHGCALATLGLLSSVNDDAQAGQARRQAAKQPIGYASIDACEPAGAGMGSTSSAYGCGEPAEGTGREFITVGLRQASVLGEPCADKPARRGGGVLHRPASHRKNRR